MLSAVYIRSPTHSPKIILGSISILKRDHASPDSCAKFIRGLLPNTASSPGIAIDKVNHASVVFSSIVPVHKNDSIICLNTGLSILASVCALG